MYLKWLHAHTLNSVGKSKMTLGELYTVTVYNILNYTYIYVLVAWFAFKKIIKFRLSSLTMDTMLVRSYRL